MVPYFNGTVMVLLCKFSLKYFAKSFSIFKLSRGSSKPRKFACNTVYRVNIAAVKVMRTLRTHGVCIY